MSKSYYLCLILLIFGTLVYSQVRIDLSRKARDLHFSALVFDTHVDTTPKLLTDWKITEQHDRGHIDLPRMQQGGLNALFFSIYIPGTVTGPKAVREALDLIDAVHELARRLPDRFALCTTAAAVREARKRKKIAALIGMEGGHMIDGSLAVLRSYASLGVRYLTLTHSVNTPWADSSGDRREHGGLTDFGRQVVLELNRLGVLVDVSHVSDETFRDVLATSRAPLIASHSSCRALSDHPRNMTDEMIRALAAKGGVLQINYHVEFLDELAVAHYRKAEPVMREILAQMGENPDMDKAREELARRVGPEPKIAWERIIDHIDHAVRIAGPDHVGLGSDFDGAVMPTGMEDAGRLPKITEALLERGYSERDIRKILGENTLRLLEAVERVAAATR